MIQDILLKIVENDRMVRVLSMKDDEINIPIWRREWHPGDGEDVKSSYVTMDTNWDEWRLAPPRKYILYSRLLLIVKKMEKDSQSVALRSHN